MSETTRGRGPAGTGDAAKKRAAGKRNYNANPNAGQSCGGNRHERRAAAARERNIKRRGAHIVSYVQHLPQVPIDAPTEPGRVYHVVVAHDAWCKIYDTNNPADCNCTPIVTRHVEPVRS